MTMALVTRPKAMKKHALNIVEESSHKQSLRAFVEWIIEETEGTHEIKTLKECAQKFADLKNRAITTEQAHRLIYNARLHAEEFFGYSLWNVHGKGWRICNEQENAIVKLRLIKGVAAKAWRAKNFKAKFDPRHLTFAYAKVFKITEKQVEALADSKEAFLAEFNETVQKQVAAMIEKDGGQIEHKK